MFPQTSFWGNLEGKIMTKREKAINKIKIRMNESAINVQSRNYMPMVSMALLASTCAQHIAMINTINSWSFNGTIASKASE